MKKVLLVDDDVTIHQLIGAIIEVVGDIRVESCYNGRDALERAKAEPPDLIISDVNMPDMDGLALTQQVRETPEIAHTPILLLTGRAETTDKYRGFLHGADDYLVKPFDATELQLRIKALLRRTGRLVAPPLSPPRLAAGPVELNPQRFQVRADGQDVRLTGAEFAILRHLVQHPDEVVTVEALLVQALEYPPRTGNPQVIHTHMKNIRAKLRDAGVPTAFLSSSRQGYMLVTASPAN